MPTAKILDLTSQEVGEVELADAVFGVPLNEPLIHEAVRSFLANRRAGTSDKNARRCRRRRPKALAPERHGPSANCQLAFAPLERRRERPWATATRLVVQLAQEDEEAGDVRGDFRAPARRKFDYR